MLPIYSRNYSISKETCKCMEEWLFVLLRQKKNKKLFRKEEWVGVVLLKKHLLDTYWLLTNFVKV